jgi:hypothetical protein
VDALCINQADVFERNQQVNMMGRIYKRAESVVVWLGDEGEDAILWPRSGRENTAHSWPWIEHERWNFQDDNQLPPPGQLIGGEKKYRAGIGNSVPLDLNLLQRVGAEQASRASPKATATETITFWAYKEALTYMLSRPWFHRAWTFQEIVVAQKAVVCCDAYDAQFAVFSRGLSQLDSVLSRFPGGALDQPNKLVLHDIVRSREESSLFGLLMRTSDRQASDPQDKLFSILGLLPPDLYGFMQADYSLSTKETFIWAARVCIELDNELDYLGAAGHANQRDDSLPSWVPDWLQTHTYKRLGPFRQTGEQSEMTCDAKRSRQTGLESRLERRGVGLGRLEFDEVFRSGMPDLHEAFSIATFPICAFEPPKANTSSMTRLSKSKLLEFCKSVAKHDPGQCECIHLPHRTKHCPT